MSGLGLTFLRRGNLAHPTAGSDYIKFADAEVERILIANGVSSDGVGITRDDAEKVTTFSTWFKNNTSIVSFDELIYFTNVKTIAQDAFYGCSALQSIGSANIEDFKAYSFYRCNALTSVDFSSCKSIGAAAFYNCPLAGELQLYVTNVSQDAFGNSKLTRVYLYNVSVVSKQAFQGSKEIEMVELGDKVTSIGSYAFYQSPAKMTTIICRAATPPTLGDGNTFTKATIYVPDASVDAYKAATGWSTHAARIKGLSEYNG